MLKPADDPEVLLSAFRSLAKQEVVTYLGKPDHTTHERNPKDGKDWEMLEYMWPGEATGRWAHCALVFMLDAKGKVCEVGIAD